MTSKYLSPTLDQIREWHVSRSMGHRQRCTSCGHMWPCDTAIALAAFDAALADSAPSAKPLPADHACDPLFDRCDRTDDL